MYVLYYASKKAAGLCELKLLAVRSVPRARDGPVISYDWFVVAADSMDCMYIVAQLYSVYLLEWPHLVLSHTTTSCATAPSLNNTNVIQHRRTNRKEATLGFVS